MLPTDAPTLVFPSSRVLVFSRAQSQRAGFIIFCVGFLVDVLAKGATFSMHAEQQSWFCGILPSGSESGTGPSGPLDGSTDTLGGSGYLLGS